MPGNEGYCMSIVKIPRQQRLILPGISWNQYVRLLRGLADRHVRLTYDRGVLEFMTLSHEHESEGYILGRFVDTLTDVLAVPVKGGKSTTFKRRTRRRGLEPDGCWWIQNEAKVRGKKKIDLAVDPAPDLALEIDISRSSLNRLAIYAALRVPEIWRFDGEHLTFLVLRDSGKYENVAESLAFPGLRPDDLLPFLAMHHQLDETTVVRQFRAWAEKRFGKA
jgi:Uma2 family endonuclease